MPSLLLAESGSTKTDWCLLRNGERVVKFRTAGINPYLQTPEAISRMLGEEMSWKTDKHKADAITFYGAGAGSQANQKLVHDALQGFFGIEKVEVQSDMMAAAHALCGKEKGVVCILGTGSNSCYFDGKRIADQQNSLGYIAGDEGSGNYMGKRVLQYYAYHTFDDELKASFEMLFGNDLTKMLHSIYREPFPNRYLAGFVELLTANRGHFMVENIIEDCLNDFFHHHILKYRSSWKQPIHFTGSVAWGFKDVITSLCHQYELEVGTIVRSPMDKLILFYQHELESRKTSLTK
jgi:N-acetylglucosamine kinase-like BadF-type ATPase